MPDCLPLDYVCINGIGHITRLPDLHRCQIARLVTLPDCQTGSTARLPDRLLDLVNRIRQPKNARLPCYLQDQIARLLSEPDCQIAPQAGLASLSTDLDSPDCIFQSGQSGNPCNDCQKGGARRCRLVRSGGSPCQIAFHWIIYVLTVLGT